MKNIKSTLLSIFFSIVLYLNASAQSLPVGTPVIEDYYRRQQLLSNADSATSFTIRPLFPHNNLNAFFPDSAENIFDREQSLTGANGKFRAALLPFSLQTMGNSDHPYGWNDGPMVPARGFQALLSLGFFAQYGPLTIQFRPELVSAQNSYFETFSSSHYDVIYARYYDNYNNVDLPVRFGNQAYNQAFWGQSSVRLNYKSLSAGLSTENLWWGPGIRNSLLMSNTAPGFLHFTFNTSKPIKTPIGSFEGMIIGGALTNSNFAPLTPDKFYFGTNLYVPKPVNRRYLSGMIVTWQPKWVPGLFLGFDKSRQAYKKDLNGIGDYLPFFSSIKHTSAPDKTIDKFDELSSVFMRWVWPQEHAEVYFQYGKYNNSQDFEQELLNPSNARAYIFGLRKLLPFKKSSNENILVGIEVTQLQNTSMSQIIQGQGWYKSQNVRQGYTNWGQALGAGSGPGSNLQSLQVSWVKGLKKIGVQFERYVHDNDFYYYAFQDSKDYTRHWVDLSMAFNGEWNYKNLIFNANVNFINSLNYQWALSQPGNDINFQHQTRRFNLQLLTGVTYRF